MDLEKLASTLKALADPTRLRIIALLNIRDWCVCELVPLFGISQPAVSKHMSRLKAVGLVKETRRGVWVFYSLNKIHLQEVGISLNELMNLRDENELVHREDLHVECEGVAT
ncbi:hypothetical protein Alches_14900 [Alicyclobacillus hesperidum subsp. aegles]|uniref:ArsR/SmtB family transcription factor n=1 Tax=Alicyclobacillus hesperidum TaxID=89784 RepID=UPI00222D9588|nr:metalloregulator ArsR/SmtB family transcription factor [Alicyclobacillus hesperidum]GLG01451.1 hypothetical protein Alches_14900 [Alicyclobacillus hesperidum subsp. aegles]